MSIEKKILVFTATFNELDNIKNLVYSIKKQPSNPHILIIDDNSPDGTSEEIKKLHSNKSGLIEFTIKAPEDITTSNGTLPDGSPTITGVQQAPISNVNLRDTFVTALTNNITTSLAAYPYTEMLPKDGDFAFLAECEIKPEIDFNWETRFATPVKAAAWERICDEAITDVVGLQDVAIDYLRKKHNLKKQSGILFGDGIAPNPKGATTYGKPFPVAGAFTGKVADPQIMDVILASAMAIKSTHNYVDEMSYIPNLVLINDVDFYNYFQTPKDQDGRPLYPEACTSEMLTLCGMTIISDRSIPLGKIFVADMSKYNTTNYVDYTVQIGWINDDFIKNRFVILGESRFHAFVKKLDEVAFLYDDIQVIVDDIKKV